MKPKNDKRRYEVFKPSWKFRLFGEWKIFYWIFGGVFLIGLSIYGLIGFIAAHFIKKFW
jgi:hypothetical protein